MDQGALGDDCLPISPALAAAAWSFETIRAPGPGRSGPRVPAPLIATSNGFSLHAATLIRKGERAQLEKLCRYVTRPAIAPHPQLHQLTYQGVLAPASPLRDQVVPGAVKWKEAADAGT